MGGGGGIVSGAPSGPDISDISLSSSIFLSSSKVVNGSTSSSISIF